MVKTSSKLYVLRDAVRKMEGTEGAWLSRGGTDCYLILSLFTTYPHLSAARGGKPLLSIFTLFFVAFGLICLLCSHSEGCLLPFANAGNTNKKPKCQREHCNKHNDLPGHTARYWISPVRGHLYKNSGEVATLVPDLGTSLAPVEERVGGGVLSGHLSL